MYHYTLGTHGYYLNFYPVDHCCETFARDVLNFLQSSRASRCDRMISIPDFRKLQGSILLSSCASLILELLEGKEGDRDEATLKLKHGFGTCC